MKEWCLQHPWMTFFIIIFAIGVISRKIRLFLGQIWYNMKNIKEKGEIKMNKKKGNVISKSNSTGGRKNSTKTSCNNQKSSESVKPTNTLAPPPPPKQK